MEISFIQTPDAEQVVSVAEQTTLHDTLLSGLRTMVLEGELPSGARIPEADLCRRFNVSRTPLREALKVLAAESFVELRPNRGAIVTPIDPGSFAPIFEVKGSLERLIGLTAAVRATAQDLADLEDIHARLNGHQRRKEPAAYTRLNHEFHCRMAQTTHNPVLVQTYTALQQKLLRFRFAINELPERLEASFAEHEHIMIALRARARLDLAERLEEHNRLTGEAMEKAFQAGPGSRANSGKNRRKNR
jgi:DNA-binding GntR family transcriptional regulator